MWIGFPFFLHLNYNLLKLDSSVGLLLKSNHLMILFFVKRLKSYFIFIENELPTKAFKENNKIVSKLETK